MTGMAFGAGSAVAHEAVRGIMGGGHGHGYGGQGGYPPAQGGGYPQGYGDPNAMAPAQGAPVYAAGGQ